MVARVASIKKSTVSKANKANDKEARVTAKVTDSFVNYALNIGMGSNNALSQSTYGFNPLTLQRTLLEFIYRGSWMGGLAVDLVADDMTRAGVEIHSDAETTDVEKLQAALTRLRVWTGLNETVKWARLYGGAIAVMLIEGQDASKPLRIEAVGRNQFKGLLVLDRWMVEPVLENLVKDLGPSLGLPEYYRIVGDAPALRGQKIHYTRCIRLMGADLPYWQRVANNLWGLSVIERIYDRMVAFDSATQGAAQLVYRSYIRTYYLKGLRDAQTTGGDAMNSIVGMVDVMRKYQSNEGITLLDSEDKFDANSGATFTGIGDALLQFGQQMSGALQIPLVRLFGQSPAGLNSTGESDLRTYYDGIREKQENDLRDGVDRILRVTARSEAIELGDSFGFSFVPLWQLNEDEKSQIAQRDTQTILEVQGAGLLSDKAILQELSQMTRVTGRWSNITPEMIEEADENVKPPPVEGELPPLNPELTEGAAGNAPSPFAVPSEGGDRAGNGKASSVPAPIRQAIASLSRVQPKRTRDRTPYSMVGDLQVVIEQPKGSIRRGEGWTMTYAADYGYVRRVGSAEGEDEWMDCFVGPDLNSREVWVIDSIDPQTGKFDEHKLCLGARTAREAIDMFKKTYNDFRQVGSVTHMSMDSYAFKHWLAEGDKKIQFKKWSTGDRSPHTSVVPFVRDTLKDEIRADLKSTLSDYEANRQKVEDESRVTAANKASDAIGRVIRDMVQGMPAPVVNVTVPITMPKKGVEVTKVTKYDSNGRIQEFERSEVDDPNEATG